MQPDPVEIIELREILALHLPAAGGLMKCREAKFLEEHLLSQLDELVEIQLDVQFLPVVVAPQEPSQRLDLVRSSAGPAPAAGPLGQKLRLLSELERGKIQGRDPRLHLSVDDQLVLLDDLGEVLLEILPQKLIVPVLGDAASVNLHPASLFDPGAPAPRSVQASNSAR